MLSYQTKRIELGRRASELKNLLRSCYGEAAWAAFDEALADYTRHGANWGEFWDLAEALGNLEQLDSECPDLFLACHRVYCAAEAYTGSMYDGEGNPKKIFVVTPTIE